MPREYKASLKDIGDRITLPKEFRELIKVSKGDILQYEIKGDTIVLRPFKVPKNPTKNLFGLASEVSENALEGDNLVLFELNEKQKREV